MVKANIVKRRQRVRNKLRAKSGGCPRLSVHVSNAHLYVQLIDDTNSNTIASSSSLQLKLSAANKDSAAKVGKDIAEKAKKIKVTKVVFDRGSYLYHGKVKAVAEAARENGLKF